MQMVIFALMMVVGIAYADRYADNTDITDKVFFDISIGGSDPQRVVFGLFGNVVPKTAENFRELAVRPEGEGYKGSKFHKVVDGTWIQGGDYTVGDGTGGQSIYGAPFEDENFILKHEPYVLSMANSGTQDTNGSQFFITIAKTPWLDGKHVVFGKVIQGSHVIRKIRKVRTDHKDRPRSDVVIVDCGTLPENE